MSEAFWFNPCGPVCAGSMPQDFPQMQQGSFLMKRR